jgi:hypothetical protein
VDTPRLGRWIKQADQSFLLDELNEWIGRANEELKPSKYNSYRSAITIPTID